MMSKKKGEKQKLYVVWGDWTTQAEVIRADSMENALLVYTTEFECIDAKIYVAEVQERRAFALKAKFTELDR
jgi:hypothetical protein